MGFTGNCIQRPKTCINLEIFGSFSYHCQHQEKSQKHSYKGHNSILLIPPDFGPDIARGDCTNEMVGLRRVVTAIISVISRGR
jgi:hypothetical protein